VLNQRDFGFSKLTVHNEKKVSWQFIKGGDGSLGDEFTLLKKDA
jgi:acid phosphatase